MSSKEEDPIPVTCFTGFLGAGKTTTILSLLKALPKNYKVVLLKNEYGDVEVDSLLANQSQITGVSEILNGCMCCTMVGLVENALIEVKEKFTPDRIIIESSGSAFPATLALQIRQLAPQGFKLDGVVTVIDCVNFRGYEDTSPSAKLQAKYTDLMLLNKHDRVSERDYDILMDHLGTLNDTTPRVRISSSEPLDPNVIFGLDTKLFMQQEGEKNDWSGMTGSSSTNQWHGDEVEVKTIWRGGSKPGTKKRKRDDKADGQSSTATPAHSHPAGEDCACDQAVTRDTQSSSNSEEIQPLDRALLEEQLGKLNFEIYRVKGIVRLADESGGFKTHILNYAFGRHELTPFPTLDEDEDLLGVSIRLTVMGERGEVASRARKLAAALSADFA